MTALDDPASLTLTLPVTTRLAEKDDLDKLEWYGQYRHYRNLIRRAYREQTLGRRAMLLADVNGFPVGQLFVQFVANNSRIADGRTRGYFYSFRVMEIFRGQGIGTQLIRTGEGLLRDRGCTAATIAVAKENEGALRLYLRQGYTIFAEDPGRWSYIDHKGRTRTVHEPCWILEKSLENG
jgi:ribosomal protein S18 acetylase RimI-like enzyme